MHTHATPHDDTFTLPLSFLYRVFALLIFPTVPIPQGPGTRRSRVGMETITCGWGAAGGMWTEMGNEIKSNIFLQLNSKL